MSKNKALMLAAVLFAAVFIGQAFTYYAVPNRYDASAEFSGPAVNYTVSTNSAVEYTVSVYSDASEVKRLFIYYDESYAVYGTTHAGQDRFIRQMISELSVRGFTGVFVVNATELSDTLDASAGTGDAVLMTSGVMPDTVYSETESKMFDWVETGGNLYWIGYAIGAKYAVGGDLKDVPAYQEDIFGADGCILMDSVRSTERSADPLSSGLMLNNNNLMYSLNTDAIAAGDLGLKARSLGFEQNGYGSVSLVEIGSGMICVLGGHHGSAERSSAAQLISSGITVSSELIGIAGGPIVRNTISGTMDIVGYTDVGVHIRMGEPNTVYARSFFQ